MSYNFVLLPSGAASTASDVEGYLAGQQGRPATTAVASIATALNQRNNELPEADTFLDAPVDGADSGATLHVQSPYDAIGHVRNLLFELATPLDYAVYDPQLAWLIDPAGHVPVAVFHGGAGEFPYLTRKLIDQWIDELAEPGPYLIIERAPEVYIQTFRHPETTFTLEYRDGSPDKHFSTTLADPPAVADLIWNWTLDDRTRFDTVTWKQLDF